MPHGDHKLGVFGDQTSVLVQKCYHHLLNDTPRIRDSHRKMEPVMKTREFIAKAQIPQPLFHPHLNHLAGPKSIGVSSVIFTQCGANH